jgi:hypothetical protein
VGAAQLAARAAQARTEAGIPERERRRVWALDAKTLRGARDDHHGQTHLVSVLDQATGAVLAQVAVDAKSGERAVVPELLAGLDLHDVPLTTDALHTQRCHAHDLHHRGGHHVHDGQGQPADPARTAARAAPDPDGPAARERARGHGRVETRTISVVSRHPCPDQGGEFFPHAAQAIKLVGRRWPLRPGGRRRTVTVYAITSLTAFQADPVLLARWIRGH